MTEQQKPEHYQALTKEDYQKLIFDSPLNIDLKLYSVPFIVPMNIKYWPNISLMQEMNYLIWRSQ